MTTPANHPLVSVVLSFRNEEGNLPELAARLSKMFAAQPFEYELLFVNDASTDGSLDALLQARASNERIRILTMSRPFGVAECVRAGLAASRGDAVIYMDTDLQDPPEVIPSMLDAWRRGAEVVHTVRSRRHGENPLKTWLTGVAYRMIRFGATIDLPVDAGDFKLLTRKAVDRLLALRESDPYLRGLVVWLGFQQVFVAYERDARHRGATHFPFFSRNPWKTFALGLTSFSFAPIYACAALAAAGLAVAAGLLGIAVVRTLAGTGPALRPALLGVATFFWATTLGAISIVGVYVIRTYKDVRGRPEYIVASTVGFDEDTR